MDALFVVDRKQVCLSSLLKIGHFARVNLEQLLLDCVFLRKKKNRLHTLREIGTKLKFIPLFNGFINCKKCIEILLIFLQSFFIVYYCAHFYALAI